MLLFRVSLSLLFIITVRFGTRLLDGFLDSSKALNTSEVRGWATLGNNCRTAELGRRALLNRVECFFIGINSLIWLSESVSSRFEAMPSTKSPLTPAEFCDSWSMVTKRTDRLVPLFEVEPVSSSEVVLFWSSECYKLCINLNTLWRECLLKFTCEMESCFQSLPPFKMPLIWLAVLGVTISLGGIGGG